MKNIARLVAALMMCAGWGCASSRPYTEESVIKAQQSQSAARRSSLPATSQSLPAPPAASAPVEQSYPETNIEHWIVIVLDRGAQIKLEDGSLWEIAPKDRIQTMTWQVADKIKVVNGADPRHHFRVTNVGKGSTVDASLISTQERP